MFYPLSDLIVLHMASFCTKSILLYNYDDDIVIIFVIIMIIRISAWNEFVLVGVSLGGISGAGNAGCTNNGQGGFCQAADRERCEHAPFPHHHTPGGTLQHGTR